MSTEWKPGDVAMVVCSDGNERPAIVGTRYIDDSPVFVFGSGGLRSPETSRARRLVVIDPESDSDIKRLCDAYRSVDHGVGTMHMQKALREFANPTPPKPDEPMGFGAVVSCDPGPVYEWALAVRTSTGHTARPWEWRDSSGNGGPASWSELKALEVLSDGVTP